MSRTATKAALKQSMLQAAGQMVLVADSSKYGHHSFQRIAPLDSFDALVSDSAFPKAESIALLDAGINLCLPKFSKMLSPRLVES